MAENAVASRSVRFGIGAYVTALCGFVVWVNFLLLTMMPDPNLKDDAYWDFVKQRMIANIELSVLLFASCAGLLFGVVLMGRAAFGRFYGPDRTRGLG